MQGLQVRYHNQHYSSLCPNLCRLNFFQILKSLRSVILGHHSESSSYLHSLFLRSCRVVQALAMWSLSAHLGHRAGCRLQSPPKMLQDMSSRMKASLPSHLTKSKSGFTTTKEKVPSVQWPPSTQQRKVCTIPTIRQILCSLNSGNVQQ